MKNQKTQWSSSDSPPEAITENPSVVPLSFGTSPAPRFCLIHYGEITLRGRNRSLFEDQVLKNVLRSLSPFGPRHIQKPRGRLILEFDENPPWESIFSRLKKCFGIANLSPAFQCPPTFDVLKEKLAQALKGRSFQSFGVRARRANKKFEKDSMEIEREIGRFVETVHPARVDLESPACWIRIEVGEREIYFSFEKVEGPGGLPQPLAGRVVSLISGGIDSPVAAYQLMRRGCEVIFIHFHSTPYTTPASIAKVRRIVKLLTEYQMDSKLYLVGLGEVQQKIIALAPPEDRVVLYRRAMVKIAERIARKESALSLVTGEVLGQVASQTLTNLTIIEAATSLPLFRPLIGMDKREVVDLAKKIGTYPLSILPDQDCCSYMLPPSPTTRAKRVWIEQTENELNIQNYIDKSISEAQSETFRLEEDSL